MNSVVLIDDNTEGVVPSSALIKKCADDCPRLRCGVCHGNRSELIHFWFSPVSGTLTSISNPPPSVVSGLFRPSVT